jgi:hypothetical protein
MGNGTFDTLIVPVFSLIVCSLESSKGQIETELNKYIERELTTLLDELYLVSLFHYLPLPPSAPAVGKVSVSVAVAYIAAVVEMPLACLCSTLCVVVEPQC